MREGLQTEQPELIIELINEPVVVEENGRVISVTFPPQLFDTPPVGVDPRQLQLIQAASNANILPRINSERVRRIAHYYGTDATLNEISQDEEVSIQATSEAIHRTMVRIHRMLFSNWFRERHFKKRYSELRQEFLETFPLEVIKRGKDSGVILQKWRQEKNIND